MNLKTEGKSSSFTHVREVVEAIQTGLMDQEKLIKNFSDLLGNSKAYEESGLKEAESWMGLITHLEKNWGLRTAIIPNYSSLETIILNDNFWNALTSAEKVRILAYFVKINCCSDRFLRTASRELSQSNFIEAKIFTSLVYSLSVANYWSGDVELKEKALEVLEKEKMSFFDPKLFEMSKIKALCLFFSLNLKKDSTLHLDFLLSLEKYFQTLKNQFSSSQFLKVLFSFLETIEVSSQNENPEFIKQVEKIKAVVPFQLGALKSSTANSRVAKILDKKGINYEQEKRIGCYFVDFFIPPALAIEINGPFHYFSNTKRRTGYNEVKYNNLRARGIKVKEVASLDVKSPLFQLNL